MSGDDFDSTKQLTPFAPDVNEGSLIADHFPRDPMNPSEDHVSSRRFDKTKIAVDDTSTVDANNANRAGTVALMVGRLKINRCK